jgi:hypothetical protein
MTPSITVHVDLTNPGQFFACCGLLELADRLWPGAEGWFSEGGKEFCIACAGTLKELLSILVMYPPTAIERLDANGLDIAPIIAPLLLSFDGGATIGLVLDAWTQIRAEKGTAKVISNPPWNFWSGQQTSLGIWLGLREELAEQLSRLADKQLETLFDQRRFQRGRFGFDCGPAWNALDVGFSPNEHNMKVESSSACELLAVVGLQRFRPLLNEDRDGFDYFTWHNACSPAVAAAAMAGALQDRRTLRFRASVMSRGQYAALGAAFLLNAGDPDD